MVDVTTKTRIKLARTQHDVHVGLLMMHEGLSKPDAIIMAYLDGYPGLADRMQGKPPSHQPAKPEANK